MIYVHIYKTARETSNFALSKRYFLSQFHCEAVSFNFQRGLESDVWNFTLCEVYFLLDLLVAGDTFHQT